MWKNKKPKSNNHKIYHHFFPCNKKKKKKLMMENLQMKYSHPEGEKEENHQIKFKLKTKNGKG